VIVAAAGTLAAYDLATGKPRWIGPVTSIAPGSGALLWEYAWPGAVIVQPALTADGDVLVSTAGASGGLGMRRIAVAGGPGGWTAEERWTSTGLKPYFNDLIVHKDHAFGFDGSVLACIGMEDGVRKWKGGRYGYGQLLLLPDQDVLLVLSEEGELALVGGLRTGSGRSRGSRPSKARRGTTRSSLATSCWSATARRWPRSGCPSQAADAAACRYFAGCP